MDRDPGRAALLLYAAQRARKTARARIVLQLCQEREARAWAQLRQFDQDRLADAAIAATERVVAIARARRRR